MTAIFIDQQAEAPAVPDADDAPAVAVDGEPLHWRAAVIDDLVESLTRCEAEGRTWTYITFGYNPVCGLTNGFVQRRRGGRVAVLIEGPVVPETLLDAEGFLVRHREAVLAALTHVAPAPTAPSEESDPHANERALSPADVLR
jgi:hypothetical protein